MKPKTLILAVSAAGLIVLATPRWISPDAPEGPLQAFTAWVEAAERLPEAGPEDRQLEALEGRWEVEAASLEWDGPVPPLPREAYGRSMANGRFLLLETQGTPEEGRGTALLGYDSVAGEYRTVPTDWISEPIEVTGSYAPESNQMLFEGDGFRWIFALEADASRSSTDGSAETYFYRNE